LQSQLKERDSELSRAKIEFELHSKSQSQTDLKLQDIQQDYQNLYNEMRDFEETCIRLKADKEKLKRDIDSLIADLANREL
jgi:septal ring factor EnvC (AmiA/AmiB activator)